MIEEFLAGRRAQGHSPHTIAMYRKVLRAFAAWLGVNDLTVESFRLDQVAEYREHLRHRQLRPRSINSYLGALRTYATWLGVDGLEQVSWHQSLDLSGTKVLARVLWGELLSRNWTLADLSHATGLPIRQLGPILRRQRTVSPLERLALARGLGYTPQEFHERTGLQIDGDS